MTPRTLITAATLTLLLLTARAEIVKPTFVYPLSNLPPVYPADGFPLAPDFVLPGTVVSSHVASVVGLIYLPLNATHGSICSATTINKRWILTSAHCLTPADRRTARVYLPNPAESRYDVFGMRTLLRHRSFDAPSSSADIALAKLRRFNRNVPFLRPKIHGSVDNANRPGLVRVLPRFVTPVDDPPALVQSQQVTAPRLCTPDGTTDGSFLCTTVEEGADDSGAAAADSGAPLIGSQRNNHRRVAVIGLYAGSSNDDFEDVARTHFFVIVGRFRRDLAAARFGDLTNWVEL